MLTMKRYFIFTLFLGVAIGGNSQLDSTRIESDIQSNATKIDALIEEQVGLGSDLAGMTTELQSMSQEVSSVAFSQSQLNNRLDAGLKDVASLKNSVWSHRKQFNSLLQRLDSVQAMQQELMLNLQNLNAVVIDSIDAVQAGIALNKATLTSEGERIDARLSEQSKISYASYLFALAVAGVILVLLVKRLRTAQDETKEETNSKIEASRMRMQEQMLEVDQKLAEALTSAPVGSGGEDHSLALKVADEITRIESNLSQMDDSVRGYKQLSRSVSRVKDNLMASGYEMVEMLGKPYDEGMIAEADFTQDENFEAGQQVVTRVTRPEIRFNGTVIQTARITVSHG